MPISTAEVLFKLAPYGGLPRGIAFSYVVIAPAGTSAEAIGSAWAYAVRYTAKGLDLPDHDAALQKFSERHPSWKIIQADVIGIAVNLALAEQDIPENPTS